MSIKRDYQRLERIEAQLKELEAEKKALKSSLEARIPAGYAVDGVYHEVTTGASVSYAKVFDQLLVDVIPKTRHGRAMEIRDLHTKETERNKLRLAKPGDPVSQQEAVA